MERHQQPQRECKSPLLSMNNTKLSSYYVLWLSWVVITAPDPFSRLVVCIKQIFPQVRIKGLVFISSDLQLFISHILKKSHHLLLISDHLFCLLFFFTQRRNQSLCWQCQREISNLLKVSDGRFGEYNIVQKKLQLGSFSRFTRSKMD